jgi:redox-sensitive bicupin YhaK (pirin superfamily)
MRAGRGVWHTGAAVGESITKGFQLWLALPEELELAPSQSRYLSAEEVPTVGAARLILGRYQGASSAIPAPAGINYFDVQLKAGESWTYRPPSSHSVAWLALSLGAVHESHFAGFAALEGAFVINSWRHSQSGAMLCALIS